MKKIISLLLATLLLLCIQIPAFANGEEEQVGTGLIYEETFESGALDPSFWRTNTKTQVLEKATEDNPSNYAANLTIYESVGEDGKPVYDNSQLNMGVSAKNRFPVNHRFIYEYDILYGANISDNTSSPSIYVYESDGSTLFGETYTLVKFTSNKDGTGTISATGPGVDDKETGSINAKCDEWYNIRVYVNMEACTYSVCINGELIKTPGGCTEFELYNYSADRNKNITPETAAEFCENGGTVAPLFQTSQWMSKKMTFWIDNIRCYSDVPISFADSSPKKNETGVIPFAPISATFEGSVVSCEFELDGEAVDASLVKRENAKTFSFTPGTPLSWGKTYTLTAKAKSFYGVTLTEEITFTVMDQPNSYVRLKSFSDETGEDLTALKNGTVNANLEFIQKTKSKYTYIICLYKNEDGYVQLVGANCGEIETEEPSTDITIGLNVEDSENCFVKVCVLDGLSERTPYEKSVRYGFFTLE